MTIELPSNRFPNVIPRSLSVGDNVWLTVTARITRIEEEQIDGGWPKVLPGDRTTTLVILSVEHISESAES